MPKDVYTQAFELLYKRPASHRYAGFSSQIKQQKKESTMKVALVLLVTFSEAMSLPKNFGLDSWAEMYKRPEKKENEIIEDEKSQILPLSVPEDIHVPGEIHVLGEMHENEEQFMLLA